MKALFLQYAKCSTCVKAKKWLEENDIAVSYTNLPINWIFKQWKKLLTKVFRLHPSGGITEEELITIVEELSLIHI